MEYLADYIFSHLKLWNTKGRHTFICKKTTNIEEVLIEDVMWWLYAMIYMREKTTHFNPISLDYQMMIKIG